MTESPYLTIKQAADALDMDTPYILRLIQRGRFPGAIKPGHDWLIPRKSVQTFERRPGGRPKRKTKA